MVAIRKGNMILDSATGEVFSPDCSPRFKGWKLEDYKREFERGKQVRYLEPMTAYELEDYSILKSPNTVADLKYDGHRALVYVTDNGLRAFSRRISKETGWYAENTDCLPHIRDVPSAFKLVGTVLDGEIVLPIKNCTSKDVQSVTGALPETAILNQLSKGFARFKVFDILYYKGLKIQAMPLWKRRLYVQKAVAELSSHFIILSDLYATPEAFELCISLGVEAQIVADYEELYAKLLADGQEGLIIKDLYGKYEQKRSKAYLKMKAHNTYDVVIMGYEEPTRLYEGKELDTWKYWEGRGKVIVPVTKFYASNWIGALIFGVYKNGKLVEVGRASGMDEDTRQMFSENRKKYIGQVVEVMAQGIINKETGSLRHPRYACLREDKSAEMCTFEDHIRE